MALLLPDGRFPAWLGAFLPGIARGEPAALFEPAVVSDASDGQIAHLHGLNASRAWCWRRIAESLPAADPRTEPALAAARRHAGRGAAARGRRPLQRRALARGLRGAAADLTPARSLRCRGEHAAGSDSEPDGSPRSGSPTRPALSGCWPMTCTSILLGDDAQVVAALAAAPDPDLALAGLARLGRGRAAARALRSDPGLRARLAAVLGTSTALADHLRRHPDDWRLLSGPGAERAPEAGELRADLLERDAAGRAPGRLPAAAAAAGRARSDRRHRDRRRDGRAGRPGRRRARGGPGDRGRASCRRTRRRAGSR